MAKKSNGTTALAKWDAKLAELAGAATQMEGTLGSGGNFLSFKSGVMSYQGTPIPGNIMSAVVLAATLHNKWFAKAFDPDTPSSPDCYAFGEVAKEMVPHESSGLKQSEDCASCPQNQFGSADRGKGKACANAQRIALITEGDLENIETAELAMANLPWFSSLEYAGYVKQLNDLYHRPPLAFVTEIKCEPDAKSQFRVKFRMLSKIEDGGAIEALIARYEEARSLLTTPYPENSPAEEEKPKPVARKVAPVAAKKAAPVKVAPAAAASAAGTPVVSARKPTKAPRF